MSASEFCEWKAYFEMNPFGPDIDHLQMGVVASVVANVNRGKGKKAFSAKDFTIQMKSPEEEVQEQKRDLKEFVSMMDQMFGGTFIPAEEVKKKNES